VSAERHRRFCAIAGKWEEPFTLAPGKQYSKCVSHAVVEPALFYRCAARRDPKCLVPLSGTASLQAAIFLGAP